MTKIQFYNFMVQRIRSLIFSLSSFSTLLLFVVIWCGIVSNGLPCHCMKCYISVLSFFFLFSISFSSLFLRYVALLLLSWFAFHTFELNTPTNDKHCNCISNGKRFKLNMFLHSILLLYLSSSLFIIPK